MTRRRHAKYLFSSSPASHEVHRQRSTGRVFVLVLQPRVIQARINSTTVVHTTTAKERVLASGFGVPGSDRSKETGSFHREQDAQWRDLVANESRFKLGRVNRPFSHVDSLEQFRIPQSVMLSLVLH